MEDDESNVNRSFKEISFKVPWGVITGKAWGPDDGKPFLGLHGWLDNAPIKSKLQHPPPPPPRANPRHLTIFCARGVGNLTDKAFPGVGNLTLPGWGGEN